MAAPRHLTLVDSAPPSSAHLREVSGNWTVAAAAAGALIGSLVTTRLGLPWPNPDASGPGTDVDLVAGMAIGAPLAAAVVATFVRRVMGAAFVVPNWLKEFRSAPDTSEPERTFS